LTLFPYYSLLLTCIINRINSFICSYI